MALAPGTRLGPYAIEAPLGAGGMGEVYRARDTRLGRTVAVKVLPAHLSDNPRLQQRFEREARALAGLSHPHLCTLHDVGDEKGVRFLVMELLDGETLAARLDRGPLPFDQLVGRGIEIAEALDVAHRQGVVHRDVKPGNIMLTKAGAKLLDFGLAKETHNTAELPTETATTATQRPPVTAEGTILGTLNYMAPEQLKGREADLRTDMFAFGTVLYEMGTCERAFRGEDQASLIAAILTAEPRRMAALRPETPPALERAVGRCLAKNPEERWQSARDLMLELKWIAAAGAAEEKPMAGTAPRRWPQRLAWTLSLVLAVALAVVTLRPNGSGTEPPVARLSIILPEGTTSAFTRVSPDGRTLAFSAWSGGQRQLWIRPLDSLSARTLPRTDGARFPFWSPDSRHIGFFTDGKLKKIGVNGGPPQIVCDAPGPFKMGTWSQHGTILFNLAEVPGQEGIHRVSDAGGKATRMTIVDESGTELFAAWPSFLPDGRHFVLLCADLSFEEGGLCVASLDSSRARMLSELSGESRAEYAPPGYLLYTRDRALMAQPFDANDLRLYGEPVTIAEQIEAYGPMGLDNFSVSASGVLVYHTEGGSRSQLEWKDRNGRTVGQVGRPGAYADVSLAPDEKRLAVTEFDVDANAGDVWIIELDRDVATRFTTGDGDETVALWSPDGRQIVFSSARDAPPFLHVKPLAGGETEILLPSRGTLQAPAGWSRDGRHLLYLDRDPNTGWDIWVLPFGEQAEPVPFLRTSFTEISASFSPDGNWVAYTSDESGQLEVYVRPFEGRGEKRRISTDGGYLTRWRRDGKELFYLTPDNQLMAVPVSSGASFTSGAPVKLFSIEVDSNVIRPYDVSADGQRFIVISALPGEVESPTVVLDWTAELSSR